MTDSLQTAPTAPAPPRRGLILSLALGVVVLAAIALDTTVVRVGSETDTRQQAFSADAYGAAEFPRIRDTVIDRAVPAPDLAAAIAADQAAAVAEYGTPASTGAILMVTLTGTAGEPRAGVYPVTVEGLPEDLRIRVQTGPAINGTELRDAPGDIAFGDFTNQIEYQDAGSGINRAMAAEVLAPVDTTALAGRQVTVTGAFRLINPANWLITPVALEVE
ncbi:DUF2291 domain-containing protein [Paracoccus liaowanqingii]|uniref:DUF2291 domain-containing protein n=1 Tax=Paracoccus liaowanqingii TaxID=2560053 RepID=A0A4Z1CAY5_9RHOB|nr:DUF2291 family protein [Paracoccus liaowanqingii]TGN56570.1 DUF2291 domain-containing protein [Paracoccus liaowanqingii]